MHPWEFRRYVMHEYIDKVNAANKYATEQRREQWEMVRALAFENATIQGKQLADKKPSIYKYWPFPWDEKKGIAAITDPKERVAAIMENRRKYLKAAKDSRINNGKKDRGNNWGGQPAA